MTSISSVGSAASALQATRAAHQNKMQERLFSKVDTDHSGGVDATELQTLMDDVSSKTGVSSGSTASALMTQADRNGDAVLGADELGQAMQSLMPTPPSTLAFARSRGDSDSDGDGDSFSKVDTDGNGSIDATELKGLMDKMAAHRHGAAQDTQGTDPGATSTSMSTTAQDASAERFAQLDSNQDGSLSPQEFAAGRPPGGPGAAGAPNGPPPPTGVHGSSDTSGTSSTSSTTLDPLDTNEDGVVSLAERLAGQTQTDPLQALLQAIDTHQDGQLSRTEADSFLQQLKTQLATVGQYEQAAAGAASPSVGSTLHTTA